MIVMTNLPIRVLLVDDDREDAELTQQLLQNAFVGNYIVDWRDGFDSGLEALSVSEYDVMLLDFRLSGENGLDLLRLARDNGTRSPAILLTGQIDHDLDIKAMEAGVVDFLEKANLNSSTLERSIRYAAGRGRADRDRLLLLEAERTARETAEAAHARIAVILETMESDRLALRESEAFFRAAFLSSAVASLLVGLDGTVLQPNRAMCLLIGYTEADLTGINILDFTHPDDSAATEDSRRRMLDGALDSLQYEKRYIQRDGDLIDVHVNVGLVRRADGSPAYFTTQVFDISDRKAAQLALSAREQRLAATVAVQQEVATAALDATIMDLISARAASLTNADGACIAMLEQGELICKAGAGSGERQVGYRFDLYSTPLIRFIGERQPLKCDDVDSESHVYRELARGVDACSLICVPLFYDDAPMGVLTVFAREPGAFSEGDVYTLQLMAGLGAAGLAHATAFAAKQALVTERNEALAILSERETLIRSLLENAADPLVSLDETGIITYASPALERLLGRTANEFNGLHPCALCHPDDRDIVLAAFDHMASATARSHQVEARLAHRDGSWRTVRITGRNMLDDRDVRAIIVNMHDLTDEVEAASRLRQSQKLEAVGQLAGGVAHDFNNLLTVISGHSEFLVQSLERDDERYGDVVEIQLAADRAAALTRQLLAFSRQQMLQPKIVDLNQIVGGMQPMLRRLIGEDVSFVVKKADRVATVMADPGQLEQVVMNLAINGRDAMPNGGTLTIEVQLVALDENFPSEHGAVIPGPYVLLAITDTGVGMSQETREQIFDPFFTTKESGKGTGLGLSTVYGIIKQSNGHIWAYSEPGLWSAFKVYLPMVGAEGLPVARVDVVPTAGGSETVLFVEDEDAVRNIGRRILVREGYTVLEANDGMHALDVAAAHNGTIDLLVTDVVMPRMNGRALAERLLETMPDLAVLYLSGYTSEDILRRNPDEDGGRMRLLQKPFTMQGLTAAVRAAINGSAI